MNKFDELKTAMQTAINTFFETEDENFIDSFYRSTFTFTFNDKTTNKNYTIHFSTCPEVWDIMNGFIDSIEKSEEVTDFTY